MAYAQPSTTERHCRACRQLKREARWRRGLCRACYADPAIRARYAQRGSLAGLKGISTRGRDRQALPPLPEPTTARPGSPAKVAVLAQRAAQQQALWHPQDPACFDAGRFAALEGMGQPPPELESVPLLLIDTERQLWLADYYARPRGKQALADLANTHGLAPEIVLRGSTFATDEEE